VTIGHPDSGAPFPAVNLDDSVGIAQAVQHLIALGHRQIAHVAGDPLMLHSRRRAEAFTRTMSAAGLDGSGVLSTDFSAAGGAAATRTLLESERPPTAIVFANDLMAMAGLGVLHARSIRVPQEVSVVGFDRIDMGRHTFPSLTTVEADPEGWGAAAARTLLAVIADGHAPDVELPPAQLVLGGSTAPRPYHHSPNPRTNRSRSTHASQ
jgi:DNA-binding LacI/PurR family transcriptional regulator